MSSRSSSDDGGDDDDGDHYIPPKPAREAKHAKKRKHRKWKRELLKRENKRLKRDLEQKDKQLEGKKEELEILTGAFYSSIDEVWGICMSQANESENKLLKLCRDKCPDLFARPDIPHDTTENVYKWTKTCAYPVKHIGCG